MPEPVQAPRDTPRVPPLAAFLEGWRRVLSAPLVLLGVTAGWWLSLQARPGVLAEFELIGFPTPWSYFLSRQIRELTQWFVPELGLILQGPQPLSTHVLAAVGLHVLFWSFVSGGAMDRYARGRRLGAAAFFAACGGYAFRLLRLAIGAGLVLWLVSRVRWWITGTYPDVVVALAMLAGLVILDFARVRSVVEDRLSMIGAVTGAIRFVRRRFWRVVGLTALNLLAMLVVLRLQIQVLSSTPADARPWLVLALLIVGVAVRLAILSSQIVFFQGELAHAGYTAAPVPMWPDSPAVEAMENLQREHRLDDRAR